MNASHHKSLRLLSQARLAALSGDWRRSISLHREAVKAQREERSVALELARIAHAQIDQVLA